MLARPPDIGIDDARVSAIAALIRAELAHETDAGFPTLHAIPSAGIVKLLDHVATLTPADLGPLIDSRARVAALCFFPPPLIARAFEEFRTTDPVCVRLAEALQAPGFSYGLRYEGLRMARAVLGDQQSVAQMAITRAALDFGPRDDPPEWLAGKTLIRELQPAKAPLLRKLLTQVLAKRLGLAASKRPGGELSYEGTAGGVPLRVSIHFSNMYAQLRYGVAWSIRERHLVAVSFAYETLWGVNTGWDYLTEENAPRSIDLLEKLLLRLADLLERIAALPHAG